MIKWPFLGAALVLLQSACHGQGTTSGSRTHPCPDILRIKGYYVISFRLSDVQYLTRKDRPGSAGGTLLDMATVEAFIPQDSVTARRTLTANMAGLHACGHNMVYQLPGSNDFIGYYCPGAKAVNNIREYLPQRFRLEDLWVSTGTSGEVYKLYYLDALWTRFQINNNAPERRLAVNMVSSHCTTGPGDTFTVISCLDILSSAPFRPADGKEFRKF